MSTNPVTTTAVRAHLHLDDDRDTQLVNDVVAAVNSFIVAAKGEVDVWPTHWMLGGVMLAARLYRRRNSPAGVESFGELGAVYVQRNDPDVALMLEMGAYKRPMVG